MALGLPALPCTDRKPRRSSRDCEAIVSRIWWGSGRLRYKGAARGHMEKCTLSYGNGWHWRGEQEKEMAECWILKRAVSKIWGGWRTHLMHDGSGELVSIIHNTGMEAAHHQAAGLNQTKGNSSAHNAQWNYLIKAESSVRAKGNGMKSRGTSTGHPQPG